DQLPDVAFPPRPGGDVAEHPDWLVDASRSRLLVRFGSGTSVHFARAALADAGVEMVGALPNIALALVSLTTQPTDFGTGRGAGVVAVQPPRRRGHPRRPGRGPGAPAAVRARGRPGLVLGPVRGRGARPRDELGLRAQPRARGLERAGGRRAAGQA